MTVGLLVMSLLVVAGPAAASLVAKADCVISNVVGEDVACETETAPDLGPQAGHVSGQPSGFPEGQRSGAPTPSASPQPTATATATATPSTKATFVPTNRKDPNNIFTNPSFWDRPCGTPGAKQLCAVYPGLEIPECKPPALKPPELNPNESSPTTKAAKTVLLEAVKDAQNYYCRRFGRRGFDDLNSVVLVTPGDDLRFASASRHLPILYFSNRLVNHYPDLIPGTAIHEFTHLVFQSLIPTVDPLMGVSSAEAEQNFAVSEGISNMAEIEIRGRDWVSNLRAPLEAAGAVQFTCPTKGWFTYTNTLPLLAAYMEMARLSGAVKLKGIGTEPHLDPAWDRVAAVRWAAMSKYLPDAGLDGTLTFAELRTAFIEGAKDVGFDPGIVARAFERYGIGEDFQPPNCDWSVAPPPSQAAGGTHSP